MELDIMTSVLSIVALLLGGTNLFTLICWKSEKQRHQAEADSLSVDVKHKQLDLHQDAYEDLVNRLNKYQHDYFDLGEQMQEQTRNFMTKINDKCNEIAELKSKLIYFKGLRCYKADCSLRITQNPKDNDDYKEAVTGDNA